MKRLSLISYLKELVEQTHDFEREKEVIIYLTEFSSKKESIKNGIMLPTDRLSKASFFTQQFLVNSYFLTSKKYEIELEIFNSHKKQNKRLINEIYDNETSNNGGGAMFDFLFLDSRKELKKRLTDTEKNLDEQFDATLVLQVDSSLTYSNNNFWNWFEIVRLFEQYLLTESSMHPKFIATQDALFIESNAKQLILENQKLLKSRHHNRSLRRHHRLNIL
jgi:hypothetical protein